MSDMFDLLKLGEILNDHQKRIEALEKSNALGNEIGARLLKSLVEPTTPGPFTNTAATAAATETLKTDPAPPPPVIETLETAPLSTVPDATAPPPPPETPSP